MIRRERRDGGEGEERGLRKGREDRDRDREKRDKRELSCSVKGLAREVLIRNEVVGVWLKWRIIRTIW